MRTGNGLLLTDCSFFLQTAFLLIFLFLPFEFTHGGMVTWILLPIYTLDHGPK